MARRTLPFLLLAALGTACATAPRPSAGESPAPALAAARTAGAPLAERTPAAIPASRAWIPESRLDGNPRLPLRRPQADSEPPRRYQEGDQEFIGAVGFTSGPSTLLLTGELDHHFNEASAVGPLVQLGLDGDDTLFALSGHYKHSFYIDNDGDLSPFRPFAQGGIGFAYLEKGSRDDWSLLLHLGGGVQYHVNSTTHIGTNILVDILPGDPAGESAIFTWQLVQVGFRF